MKDRRITALFSIISAIFGILLIRLACLQLINAQTYRRLAKQNYVKPIVIEAPRGIIYSKDKKVLADNVPTYTIVIDSNKATKEEYEQIDLLFSDSNCQISIVKSQMSNALPPPMESGSRIRGKRHEDTKSHENKSSNIKVTNNTLTNTIRKVPFSIVCRIEEEKSAFPNVYVRSHPLRNYTYSEVFSHLIGYAAEISKTELKNYPDYRLGTTIGKAGVEKEYEKFLKGKDGTRYVEVDVRGREQGLLSSVSPEPGCDVWLNIDADLQLFAYEILPNKSACVAMDPASGKILLWVSKPGFDPNSFPLGISSEVWNSLMADSLAPLWDRVEKGTFPPASIFKLVTCAAALEQGIVTRETYQSVGCTGGMLIGTRKFGCWETHGSVDLIDAIILSCDVYFYQLGLQLGVEAITTQAKKVGFGNKTGVDLPAELSGFLPSEKWYEKRYGKAGWGKGVAANISVGQGEILVTPLQILYFIAGIANNGVLCTPKVVEKVVGSNGDEVLSNTSNLVTMPWSHKTIAVLREGMLGVVNAGNGTGRAAIVPGIEVAGKTGTAQNPTGKTHAWFAAFAPYEKPQIAIVVFAEHGGMGGSVCAPIVGKVLKKFFHYEEPYYEEQTEIVVQPTT
ncbi:MAG: penicillin-binding protein 2 [Candidatus Stahlbacteria bacterium]|nr:penicillin-binding protein 2 [Candidatus Stahlbacteria bacterium]